MEKPQSKKPLSKTKIALVGIAVLLIALVGTAVASYIITNPPGENVTGVPQSSPTPTPEPTITIETELHLVSNNTVPFYKGDLLQMNATITPAQEGVTITLRNIGTGGDVIVTTAVTDADGKVTFERSPVNPFNYYVTAEIP